MCCSPPRAALHRPLALLGCRPVAGHALLSVLSLGLRWGWEALQRPSPPAPCSLCRPREGASPPSRVPWGPGLLPPALARPLPPHRHPCTLSTDPCLCEPGAGLRGCGPPEAGEGRLRAAHARRLVQVLPPRALHPHLPHSTPAPVWPASSGRAREPLSM